MFSKRALPAVSIAMFLAVGWSPAAQAVTYTITGVVKNEFGVGLTNVDLDFINLCTGDNVFLVNDKTTASGNYSIVVNEGQYDVHFTPPAGSTVAAGEIRGLTVAANANLGTTTLVAGPLVSGVVRNGSGVGIPGVDIKFVDVATGQRVWVTKDVTNASGAYAARLRSGTYDLEFRPPSTTTYVTVRRSNVVVATADVGGLVDVLPTGFKLDGTVKDSLGNVVKNVDLNLYNNCSGEKIPTANDNTDVQGKYAIYVPAGTYSVHFTPPACKVLAAERVPDVAVTQNHGLGNTILQPGLAVTGRVLDDSGQPLASAKLKFYETASGARQGAANDDSDATGHFNILMRAGTFNVNVEPPSSRDLLVKRLPNVSVVGATALGDIALEAGQPVSGLVRGPSSSPVQNVNINVVDSVTRAAVILAHDSTAADGTFHIVVPAGTYDVQYRAPTCTGFAPDDQKSVSVGGPTALSMMFLVVGVHALGLVVDNSTPIANPVNNVDLDFFPAGSSLKSYTPGDSTNASGNYDVLVKPDAYDIDYTPPAGSPLRPAQRAGANLMVDVTLPVTVLSRGSLLSGTVHAQSSGLPVADTHVDVHPVGGGATAWTPHNASAADGSYAFAVDPGTWDLEFVPPDASGLAPRWRHGVVATSDVSVGDTLLLPLTAPTVTGAAPPSGPTYGGQALAILGTGFQPDAAVRVGGVSATGVSFVSSTELHAFTAPHPPGTVAVDVINPGNLVGSKPATYSYVEPAAPVSLSVARAGGDIVLSWIATGQPVYTVFRSSLPDAFPGSTVLGTTGGTTFTDVGGAGLGTLQFYNVD